MAGREVEGLPGVVLACDGKRHKAEPSEAVWGNRVRRRTRGARLRAQPPAGGPRTGSGWPLSALVFPPWSNVAEPQSVHFEKDNRANPITRIIFHGEVSFRDQTEEKRKAKHHLPLGRETGAVIGL